MLSLDISDILERFPGARIALVRAEALTVQAASPPDLERYVSQAEAALAAERGGRPVAEIAEIQAWRAAYKGFGIKSTSYRSSVERLVRTVQRHGALPRISSLVDLYNAISIRYLMPAGADDLDRVVAPLAFRFSRDGDSFIRLGDAGKTDDPPKPGEVVYADAEKVLCRRWNWHQDDRSATSTATRRAVLTVQTIAPAPVERLEAAAAELAELMAAHCGASVDWAIAERAHPIATID